MSADVAPRTAERYLRLADALERPCFWLLALLLAVTFTLGGSGRDNDLPIMMMELIATPLLAISIWRIPAIASSGSATWVLGILATILAIPLAQLIPLPPELWTALPGRELSTATLELAGVLPDWAPLTLTPEATFQSFLWMLPPAAIFSASLGLGTEARFRIILLILGLCLASLVLGGLQITDREGGLFRPHQTTHALLPTGFFSNRNHQGILMASALPFAAILALRVGAGSTDRRRLGAILYLAITAILIVGVLVTRSRAALGLSAPSLIASFALFWLGSGGIRGGRNLTLTLGALAVALVAIGQIALGAVISRFDALSIQEARFEFWPTVVSISDSMQIAGSGLGSFERLYRSAEPLEQIAPLFVNHAHNDYLELWLETGIVFPLVFVAFLAWLIKGMINAYRRPFGHDLGLARAGGVVVMILLAHSIVDYPLRLLPLACLFAFCAALVASPSQSRGAGRTQIRPRISALRVHRGTPSDALDHRGGS